MHLAISRELKKLIDQRIESGRYATPQDVVAAALHALAQDEGLAPFDPGELDQLLADGEASGPSLDGERVLAELRALRSGTQDEGR